MSTKKFKVGDRVRIKGFPFTGHTGTVISLGRFMLRKMWLFNSTKPRGSAAAYSGPDSNLRPLPPEEDPRNL